MAYQLIIKLPPGTPVNRGNVVGQDKLAFSFASAKLRAKLEEFIAQGKTGRYFTEYELGYKDKDQNAMLPMLFYSLEALEEWLAFVRQDYDPVVEEIKQVDFNFSTDQE